MVIAMTYDEAKAILDEARETLERTAHITVERRDHSAEYWSRPEPKPDPVSVQRRTTDAEAARWQNYIDGKIADAINRHAEIWREVIAQALASERQRHRCEIGKLDLRLSGLLAEVTKRQAIEAAERGEHGDVVEVPQFLERRRHA
jgi:hypothetical protein